MLEAIVAWFQRMNARLDTLNDELCQVTTRISCIARRQACLGGFVASPSPFPEASEDKDKDKDADDGIGDDNDKDANSSNDEEMMTFQ